MKEGWFRSYVEQILEEAWEQCRVAADDDGDYPYRVGTAACFVRVDQGPPLHVRVWGYAATDVRRTAKLLIELNDFNAAARSVRAYWANGAVIVEDAVLAGGVNAETLTRVCREVGRAADDIGALAAAMFDGQTPFPAGDVVEGEAT